MTKSAPLPYEYTPDPEFGNCIFDLHTAAGKFRNTRKFRWDAPLAGIFMGLTILKHYPIAPITKSTSAYAELDEQLSRFTSTTQEWLKNFMVVQSIDFVRFRKFALELELMDRQIISEAAFDFAESFGQEMLNLFQQHEGEHPSFEMFISYLAWERIQMFGVGNCPPDENVEGQ
jgi:hypothetical protein